MTITEMRAKRDAYIATARNILDKATGESRSLSTSEQQDFDGLRQKAEALGETIKRHDQVRDLSEDLHESIRQPNRPSIGGDHNHRELQPGEVRLLGADDKMSALYGRGEGDDLSIGRIVRGIATGNWKNAEAEQRAMSVGTSSAGGYLVPTPLSARLIDLARKKAVIVKAGATTVPMESATLKIARQSGNPNAAWHTENVASAASDLTFESVIFTARTLVALCKMSIELFEDSNNIDQVVSQSLSSALALELDRVGLVGSGTSPEPKGVHGATNVQTVAAGGALTGYGKFVSAFQKIMEQNGSHNGVVMAPRTWGTLEALVDSSGQPLRPTASWMDMIIQRGLHVSNQVPINLGAGTNESLVFVGDWSQLMIGMRTNLVLEAFRNASDATNSSVDTLQVWVRAYLRADIQIAHPQHFCVVTGITV